MELALLVGVVIGLVLGLTGAGGSVFAMPLLVLLMNLPMHQAVGLSLGAVAASALFGTLLKLRRNEILWLPAAIFSIVGSGFAPLGNWMNRQMDESLLLIGFSLVVIPVALRMWLQAQASPEATSVTRAGFNEAELTRQPNYRLSQSGSVKIGPPYVIGLVLGAAVTGLLSGLFGVGGGFLIVPVLLFLSDVSMKQAVATSLVVIAIVSGAGFITYVSFGEIPQIDLLTALIVGGFLGMVGGVFSSRFVAGPKLQKIFSALMIVVLVVTLVLEL